MTQRRFQSGMAIAIVLFHLSVFGLVAVLSTMEFGGQEFITTFSVVSPFMAAFMTLAINNVVENMTQREDLSAKLSTTFMFVATAVASAFAIAIVVVILMKWRGQLSLEQFTGVLGAVETALGVYAGVLLRSLFGVQDVQKP